MFQGHVAMRAFDDQTRVCQFGGTAWPDQECHVAARRLQPAAEIAADRAGTDHEDPHRLVPCYCCRKGEWLFAIRLSIPTIFRRTGEFRARRYMRYAAADRA